MPCCFAADAQRGVSDELERVLAERKVLQGQRHELRARLNEAPQKLNALQQQIRKSSRTYAEILKLQRLYKAKTVRDRNAATSAAAGLASSALFEEARLLDRVGLEPDLPCLLVEAWGWSHDSEASEAPEEFDQFDPVLLGEQWFNFDMLKDPASPSQRIEVALEPRILLSREDEKKATMQSTCGGSLLGSVGNLMLNFSHKDKDDTGKEKVLCHVHLSSKQPWEQVAIPRSVILKIWAWGGSKPPESDGRRLETHFRKGQKSFHCSLQAASGKTIDNAGRKVSGDICSDDSIQITDEVLVIGRHHSLIQRLLEDKKEFLSCVSREHLRLWFDTKNEILFIENLSSNPIRIQSVAGSSSVPAGKVARTQNGDILQFVAPESLRKGAEEGLFLSFRVIVPKLLSTCGGGSMCKGGGGDPLYMVHTVDETSKLSKHVDPTAFCASCCAQLHQANPRCSFRPTGELLSPVWTLLCESHAVGVDIVEAYPTSHTSQLPSGSALWAADFGSQKLALPVMFTQRVSLKESQAERRKAQLELAKRAETERLEERKKRKQRKQMQSEDDSIEDVQHKPDADAFQEAKPDPMYTASDFNSAGSFAPETRIIEKMKTDDLKTAPQVAEVPCELQGSAPVTSEGPSTESESKAVVEIKEMYNHNGTSVEKASEARGPEHHRKRRILHDPEPLLPHEDMEENHQRLLRLLSEKSGLLYLGEHLEVHAAVQQAALAIGLGVKVTLEFVAIDSRQFSRLEATLHVDFGALHCECEHSDFADGLPTVLLEGQAYTFQQSIDFELMDVLGQPPLLDVKASLLNASSEEAREVESFQLRLPLLTTSFLRPLRPTFRFAQEWDAPDLQAAADVNSTSDKMRLQDAEVLTLHGSLQIFQLGRDLIGFAAELPAHGCHESEAVLVRIVTFADGRIALQTRSQELRLAQAVAAAMTSILLDPPAET